MVKRFGENGVRGCHNFGATAPRILQNIFVFNANFFNDCLHQTGFCAPKTVNTLLRVAHPNWVFSDVGELQKNVQLHRTRVLKFVHHQQIQLVSQDLFYWGVVQKCANENLHIGIINQSSLLFVSLIFSQCFDDNIKQIKNKILYIYLKIIELHVFSRKFLKLFQLVFTLCPDLYFFNFDPLMPVQMLSLAEFISDGFEFAFAGVGHFGFVTVAFQILNYFGQKFVQFFVVNRTFPTIGRHICSFFNGQKYFKTFKRTHFTYF